MAIVSAGAGVSLSDVYGLLLEDIRRNRAARLAREAAQHSDADQQADDEAQQHDQAVCNEPH